MFVKTPKILAHESVLNNGNFVVPEYILNKGDTGVNLFHRFCPHRMYPLADPGNHVNEITCKFHDFQWDSKGIPINNNKKLTCGTAQTGKSGLVMKDFVEPDHRWVEDLSKEKNLVYSHSFQGTSTGSWLWLMDAEADLFHIMHTTGVHPFLSRQITMNEIEMDQGDGWILQSRPSGWWLYVYPYSFVEYGDPGMLMVNTVVPKDPNSEFGFDWISQYYYDPSVDVGNRLIFETIENVFKEDVVVSEKQRGKYFPLMNTSNKWEDHCIHWGKWYRDNLVNRNQNTSS